MTDEDRATRKKEIEEMLEENPKSVPLEVISGSKSLKLTKQKMMITRTSKVSVLTSKIKKFASCKNTTSLILSANGNILKADKQIEEIYNMYKDDLGILRITVKEIESLGN